MALTLALTTLLPPLRILMNKRKSPKTFAQFFSVLFLAGLCVEASVSEAAIPSSQTIAARVARGHGKNTYIIEQDVQFRTNAEPLILREKWIVENGERMRLSVSPGPSGAGKNTEAVQFEALYFDGKRTGSEALTTGRSAGTGTHFIEGAFHARSGKGFLTTLVHAGVLPASFLKERPRANKVEQIQHNPEPEVRLGREAGAVAWIFGNPSPVEGRLNPQVWIEQDLFNVRKIRLPDESEIAAERYSAYPGGLRLPRERTYTWNDNVVTVRLVSVRPTSGGQVERMAATSSNTGKNTKLPELAQVKEFYSRFR
jgi:hypothetical protein